MSKRSHEGEALSESFEELQESIGLITRWLDDAAKRLPYLELGDPDTIVQHSKMLYDRASEKHNKKQDKLTFVADQIDAIENGLADIAQDYRTPQLFETMYNMVRKDALRERMGVPVADNVDRQSKMMKCKECKTETLFYLKQTQQVRAFDESTNIEYECSCCKAIKRG